jgi:exodeoxyribonuclease VIII
VADAEAAGADLISADDFATCQAISRQVREHPTARKVFANGTPELSAYWTDAETGLLCKCRPDWLAMPLIVDLKSTEDASADGFQRSAWNWRYWVQAAWYMDGVQQATGQRVDAFVFGAFEKAPPYACAFYFADEAMLDMGRKEYRRLLRILADCMSSDKWPGYDTDVRALGVPLWALKAANDNERGAA